jgi:epoxyqueuosine reductase QueG
MDKKAVKELAISLGTDLVGIAAVDRFVDSPAGHLPTDKFPACKSVIVLGCTFPQETLKLDTVSYTAVRNGMVQKLDSLAEQLAAELKKYRVKTKVFRSLGGKYEKNGHFYGNISMKHAAALAGLGVIGRNYLLCNEKYGNLLWFSTLLTDMQLESDTLVDYNFCGNCSLCIDSCPSSAIDGKGIDQNACRRTCYIVSKGVLDLKCWKCREVCPHRFGFKQ